MFPKSRGPYTFVCYNQNDAVTASILDSTGAMLTCSTAHLCPVLEGIEGIKF